VDRVILINECTSICKQNFSFGEHILIFARETTYILANNEQQHFEPKYSYFIETYNNMKLAKYEAFFALTRLKAKGVLAQFVVRP
jgi:hypothetical protein